LVADVTTDHKMHVFMNQTGNPGMATAGSGDVLAGVIGAFAAKGFSALDAALAGVYIHGAAGDMAAKEIGETGMIASDISRFIPIIIKNITGK
jgi:ADP-dependent NAD(P)H-hydrate dehydratase / NAD(P)H-hydrate epimerase